MASLSSSLRRVCGVLAPLRRCSERRSSSFVRDAYINIQQQSSHVPQEQAVYSELHVREWLANFGGGKVHLEKQSNGVATIILDHPERKNALTGSMMVQLSDIMLELETWNNGRVLVLRGAGGQFCSGGDLKFVRQIADPLSGAKMCIYMQNVTSRLHRLPMISLAVVEGHALGGGGELAIACDFRVFHANAKIGFVQSKLGVTTGWGGGTHLTRQIGARRAQWLLVSGLVIDAKAAVQYGLADAVLEAPDHKKMTDQVGQFIRPILEGSPEAVMALKRVVMNAESCSYTESLNRERDVFTRNWGSAAHLRALEELEKR